MLDSAHVQRNWDSACTLKSKEELLLRANGKRDQARLLASQATHSADWLFALPISAIGLRLSNEAVRVAVAIRLGAKVCETHECPCGAVVDWTRQAHTYFHVEKVQGDSSGTASSMT